MKRRLDAGELDVGSLLRDIEVTADSLLAQAKRGEPLDSGAVPRVLGTLMALRDQDEDDRGIVEAEKEEEAEKLLSQLEDRRALNSELEQRIAAELEPQAGAGGTVEELYEGLNRLRLLEKSLTQLRTQKTQLAAQKRDLAGQMALITGNTPMLDRETKMLSRHIHLLDATREIASLSPLEASLAAPLFVLHESLLVMGPGAATSRVVQLEVREMPLASVSLECSIGAVSLRVAYCPEMDLVAAAGDHSILRRLGHEDDDGLSSPSLTTFYKGIDETAVLKSLGDFRPYRWIQNVCGIQAVRKREDFGRSVTLEQVAAKIKLIIQ